VLVRPVQSYVRSRISCNNLEGYRPDSRVVSGSGCVAFSGYGYRNCGLLSRGAGIVSGVCHRVVGILNYFSIDLYNGHRRMRCSAILDVRDRINGNVNIGKVFLVDDNRACRQIAYRGIGS